MDAFSLACAEATAATRVLDARDRPLVLVGPMGSGKTTVGTLLAKRLRRPFIDSDHELEARTGVSVATIFEIEGEAVFREREAQLLDELCVPNAALVLSTGGGSILRESTRVLLKARAIVVYLHAAPEVSFERVKRTKDRPLLNTPDPLERLRELYKARDPLYEATAHLKVETHRERASCVIDEIVAQLQS